MSCFGFVLFFFSVVAVLYPTVIFSLMNHLSPLGFYVLFVFFNFFFFFVVFLIELYG